MPFIVYGTKSMGLEPDSTSQPVAGTCGQCGQPGLFQPMKQQRFITLFWIPIIPIGKQKSIRCTNCGSLFKPPKT